MKITIIILKTLFIGALFIISNQNLHMMHSVERQAFFDLYYNWVGTLFNQGIEVTGYVVKFHWLPTNNGTVNEVLKPGSIDSGG